MNHERLLKTLALLGLSQNDAEIYLYLATKGRRRARDIAEALNLPKQRVYISLNRLRKQGTVTASHEQVTTFSAQSFEKIITSSVRKKLNEAEKIEKNKEEILSNWRLTMTGKNQKGQRE